MRRVPYPGAAAAYPMAGLEVGIARPALEPMAADPVIAHAIPLPVSGLPDEAGTAVGRALEARRRRRGIALCEGDAERGQERASEAKSDEAFHLECLQCPWLK